MGEAVVARGVCQRRNPSSVATACMWKLAFILLTPPPSPSSYISCLLDDKKRTQTEICRATALTEVTLRKVSREVASRAREIIRTLPLDEHPRANVERVLAHVALPSARSQSQKEDPPAVPEVFTFLIFNFERPSPPLFFPGRSDARSRGCPPLFLSSFRCLFSPSPPSPSPPRRWRRLGRRLG
jgi:hypothetical protein